MERWDGIREHLKTILVLILMVMLVCLCVIYMLSYQNTGQYSFTADTMRTLGGQSVKYQYADYLEYGYAAPKFVGASAKRFGEDIGIFTLGGANESVVRSLVPFYEKLFSVEGEMMPLSAEEGEALFAEALAGNHLYVAYETDLPRSVLYALTLENAMLPAVSGEYLREIVIAPDAFVREGVSSLPFGTKIYTEIYTFYAVARDSEGNYYRYTTSYVPEGETDVCFNTNYYLSYTGIEEHFPYALVQTMEKDGFLERYELLEKVSADTIVVRDTTKLSGKHLSVTAAVPDTSRVNALLWTMLVNPEQVTSFTDASGVRFYYDEGKNISMTPSGRFEYTAHGEVGLQLSSLFEYRSAGTTYDLQDYVGASLMLLRSLENTSEGENPAAVYLSGIRSDGETLTLTFGYALQGLPVYLDGGDAVLTLEFEAGMLRRLMYDMVSLHAVDGASPSMDAMFMLRDCVLTGVEKKTYGYGYIPETGRLVGISFLTLD